MSMIRYNNNKYKETVEYNQIISVQIFKYKLKIYKLMNNKFNKKAH
jgi:hypothetical protein